MLGSCSFIHDRSELVRGPKCTRTTWEVPVNIRYLGCNQTITPLQVEYMP